MAEFVSVVTLKDPKHFLKLARSFRKVNDVIFRTAPSAFSSDQPTVYTITLQKDHIIRCAVPANRVAEMNADLGNTSSNGGLDFTLMDADFDYFRPAVRA